MVLNGDVVEMLKTLPDESVQCCVTSPPYWGLRDYGMPGQIGLEKTPVEYVAKMVEVFREVRRVLRSDGVLWLNLGDSYSSQGGTGMAGSNAVVGATKSGVQTRRESQKPVDGLKPKDLVGIPWRVAFALQSDGWWLRQDIIWAKSNPMPESVTDRCTKSHEYIFLLTKSARYYYDAEAVKEESRSKSEGIRFGGAKYGDSEDPKHATKSGNVSKEYPVANRRSVWSITTKPFSGAHFATFPPEIPEICIKAGSKEGDTILDPFAGSGTTLEVAERMGRKSIGVELNPKYVKELIEPRLANVSPLFSEA